MDRFEKLNALRISSPCATVCYSGPRDLGTSGRIREWIRKVQTKCDYREVGMLATERRSWTFRFGLLRNIHQYHL